MSAPHLPAETPLAVGFGGVEVTCDHETVWVGDSETTTVADVERWATTRPGTWKIAFADPFQRTRWQFDGSMWHLIDSGRGIA